MVFEVPDLKVQQLRKLVLGAGQVLDGGRGDQLPRQLQGRRRELQGCMHLEAVTQALDVGRVADAQKHLAAAEQCLGVSSEVTGMATPRASAPLV